MTVRLRDDGLKKPPLLTRPLLVFLSAMILANIAGQMFHPLLPLYLQSLGANVGQVGLFFTLGAVAPLALQILGGWLSDSLGRLQAVAIGSLAGALSYAVYLAAPSWQWLLIASALDAMAFSFVAPSYQAFIGPAYNSLISKAVPQRLRGVAFGVFSTSVGFISLPAPFIGAQLWERFGPQAPFYIPVVATVIVLPVMWIRFKLPKDGSYESSASDIQTRRRADPPKPV